MEIAGSHKGKNNGCAKATESQGDQHPLVLNPPRVLCLGCRVKLIHGSIVVGFLFGYLPEYSDVRIIQEEAKEYNDQRNRLH